MVVALVAVKLVNTADKAESRDENHPVEDVALVILLLVPEILVENRLELVAEVLRSEVTNALVLVALVIVPLVANEFVEVELTIVPLVL